MKKIIFLLFLSICFVQALTAQSKLKLFVDCSNSGCDFDYIRQEIGIVDFVNDRRQSDVHVLIISERTANGGEKYSVKFINQGQASVITDTLHFFVGASSTEKEKREKLVKLIKVGITPFLFRNGDADKLNISFNKPTGTDAKGVKDRWNNWNFRISSNLSMNGDKNYSEKRFGGSLSATRTTEKIKLETFLYKSTARNKYRYEEDGAEKTLLTTSDYMEAEQNFVKAFSSKWSWAIEAAARSSTYDNLKRRLTTGAGIEYNFFPYKQSSTKFLVLRYMFEIENQRYLEETVYDKTSETLLSNNFDIHASFTQPWGSIHAGINYYHYLHNFSKNNLSLNANVELQLFKGISITFYGTASLIKDNLSLSKQGATSQEVLLKLKALSTNYNYYTGLSISYRFGSKFNNIVNPRFTDGRY